MRLQGKVEELEGLVEERDGGKNGEEENEESKNDGKDER